jgi:hypothetical protein
MKRILLIFLISFFIFISNSFSKQIISTIATVNNIPITNIDIGNEIFLLKAINPKAKEIFLKNLSLKNLVEQVLKNEEIKINNIKISEEYIEKKYNNFLFKFKINKLPENIKKNIYLKIKTEESWNLLIRKKFSWSAYVNINEIEKNINYSNKKKEDLFEIKDKMIQHEKNKKINISSKTYLNKLKKEALIKIH